MKFKKIVVVSLIFLLVFLSFTGCGSTDETNSEDEPIVLALASDAPFDHIATDLNNGAAEKIKKRTHGRIEIQYFPESQLGSYETVYEEVVMGSIDIAQITVPDSLDPRLGAAYLPYYATNFEEAEILYAPDSYISSVFSDLTSKTGVKFLGWVLEGFIGMGVVTDPKNVTEPGKEKDIKLRTPSMATFRYALEDLGYIPISVTYAEVPVALQTKVVDGWVGGTPNMNYAWVGELINKMYINYMYAEATCYVMSQKSLSKLSKEDQQIVIDVFHEQSMQSFVDAKANEELYKQKLEDDYGIEIVEFTDEEIAKNAEYVRDVTWTRLEEILTPELIEGFRDEIAKLNM